MALEMPNLQPCAQLVLQLNEVLLSVGRGREAQLERGDCMFGQSCCVVWHASMGMSTIPAW
jgi:hypothetical protein